MDGGRGAKPARGPAKGAPRRRRAAGLYVDRRDGYWWVYGTVRAGDGRRRVQKSLGLPLDAPREVAEDKARLLQAELVRAGVYGEGAAKAVGHAAAAYLDERARDDRPPGWRDKERPLVRRIVRALGMTPLASLGTAAIEAFLDREFGGTGAENRRRVCSTLGGILGRAVELGWLASRPHLPRPRATRRKVNKWLWPREVELLFKCCAPWFRPQAMFLFYQGRRPGESVALRCDRVDLTPGRERFALPETKTGEEQWSALRPEVAAELRLLRAARTGAGIPWEGAVFRNSRGLPWHDTGGRYGGVFHKPWARARERAAAVVARLARLRRRHGRVEEAADLDARADVLLSCTPHWGRHTFASLGRMQGVDPKILREAAGWRTASMLDRYSHLDDAHMRLAFAGMAAPKFTQTLRTPADAVPAKRKRRVKS